MIKKLIAAFRARKENAQRDAACDHLIKTSETFAAIPSSDPRKISMLPQLSEAFFRAGKHKVSVATAYHARDIVDKTGGSLIGTVHLEEGKTHLLLHSYYQGGAAREIPSQPLANLPLPRKYVRVPKEPRV